MVRDSIKDADALQRRSYVPEEQRTSDRDAAADWLESELVNDNRDWAETTLVSLSDESGWSREHIARTIDSYFDPADGPTRSQIIEEIVTAAVNADHSGKDYPAGFRDGFTAGLDFARTHEETVQD